MWLNVCWAYVRHYGRRARLIGGRAVRHVLICALQGHQPKMDLGGRCMNCGRKA